MCAMRVLLLGILGLLIGGCASLESNGELARLKSRIAFLEGRVTQLERTGTDLLTPDVSVTGTVDRLVVAPVESAAPAKDPGKPSTREIQYALQNAGFYQGEIDGKLGPLTRQAVLEFQRVHGLKDDGIVGRQTWAQLRAYADLSTDE